WRRSASQAQGGTGPVHRSPGGRRRSLGRSQPFRRGQPPGVAEEPFELERLDAPKVDADPAKPANVRRAGKRRWIPLDQVLLDERRGLDRDMRCSLAANRKDLPVDPK